jgi:uncharacterized protein with von Willebrand factor type A (vWA) domain
MPEGMSAARGDARRSATPPRDLQAATVSFAGLLRREGLPVTLVEVGDAVRALEHLDLADRDEVFLGLRAVFVSRLEELPVFERCFEAFWRWRGDGDPVMRGLVSVANQPEAAEPPAGAPKVAGQNRQSVELETWMDEADDAAGEPLGVPAVSDREALMAQDFSTFTSAQLDEVSRLTIQIARRLAKRISRRRRPSRRRGPVDLRRTIRANLSRGEIIDLRRRRRKRKKLRLVLICDVSGSMDLYSRFLLQFLYALQNVFGRVESFTFSTRLTRVTEHLRGRTYRQVLRRLTEVRDWSGGTRIGTSLAEFNAHWIHLVDRRTIVLILSDGWDTGEPEVLAAELLRIRRRAARLIWLNPLLGNPSYEPLTRGMAAALPFLDYFEAAHNLEALRALAGKLSL